MSFSFTLGLLTSAKCRECDQQKRQKCPAYVRDWEKNYTNDYDIQ